MIPQNYKEQIEGLNQGKFTLDSVLDFYLDNIEQSTQLNIYVEIFEEEARLRVKELQQIPVVDRGPLWGLVMSIKDVLCYKDHKVTAGSKMLTGFESQFTSTAVQRALNAGAIIIGRTNCDEFAMGSTNEHTTYGPTLNGIDDSRVPGGSSGGAAVSVQMKTCLVALGSDTGGSVRQPAAYCGVIGMKPSYGRISRYGLIAYASSFDQIGILGHNINDISTVLDVIGGHDPMDATSSTRDLHLANQETGKNYKIATLEQILNDPSLGKDIIDVCNFSIQQLEKSGHEVSPVDFDLLSHLVPTYYVLTTAEASSNLSRYDGIRYGHQSQDTSDIHDLYINSRSEGFGLEVKRRIMMGTFVLSVGYYDAYFTKAQQVRQLIIDRIEHILTEYDAILLPTTTSIAPRLGELSEDPVQMYLSDVFTVLANICGLPAISIPYLKEGSSMPLGIQLVGRKWKEKELFSLSQELVNLI